MLPFTMPERNTQQNYFTCFKGSWILYGEYTPQYTLGFGLGLLKINVSCGEMWDAMQNFPYNKRGKDNFKTVRILLFFNEYNFAQNKVLRLLKRITICYWTGKNTLGKPTQCQEWGRLKRLTIWKKGTGRGNSRKCSGRREYVNFPWKKCFVFFLVILK